MKKILITLLLSVAFIVSVGAKPAGQLKFKPNGEFKIVQFTDTHVHLVDGDNLNIYETVQEILEIEKPDLVILTGDIVTEENPEEGYRRFTAIFSKAKVPWVVVFGNHESERGYDRKRLANYLHRLPLCLNDDKGKIKGNSNFILPVYGKDKNPKALLYCMDSNDYSTLQPTVDGYGWFDFSQIEWYRKRSSEYTRENKGNPIPALAFFHIPLPEYVAAWNNQNAKAIGVKNEAECSPPVNSGMFTAMLESGDVMGTFVGHDHINDYIGVYYGMALAYGRVTKIMKDPEKDPMAGGRVIVLTEGKRQFDTWIREKGGKKVLECRWPDSFKK
ncbi:MAG: metallophosphoesterase family protein [Bacteroidota bacterium]|nr:metallophosphoesterase family protein [Bacteroidota bacterium]